MDPACLPNTAGYSFNGGHVGGQASFDSFHPPLTGGGRRRRSAKRSSRRKSVKRSARRTSRRSARRTARRSAKRTVRRKNRKK